MPSAVAMPGRRTGFPFLIQNGRIDYLERSNVFCPERGTPKISFSFKGLFLVVLVFLWGYGVWILLGVHPIVRIFP